MHPQNTYNLIHNTKSNHKEINSQSVCRLVDSFVSHNQAIKQSVNQKSVIQENKEHYHSWVKIGNVIQTFTRMKTFALIVVRVIEQLWKYNTKMWKSVFSDVQSS